MMLLRHFHFAQAPTIVILLVSSGCSSPEPSSEIAQAPPFRAEKALYDNLKGTPLMARSSRGDKPRFTLLPTDSTGVSYVNAFQPEHARKDVYSSGFSCGGVA